MSAVRFNLRFPLSAARSLAGLFLLSALVVSGCGTAATSPSPAAAVTTPTSQSANTPAVVTAPAGSSKRNSPAPLAVDPAETPQQLLVKLFGGQQAFEIFQQPKTVQAYRLNGHNRVSDSTKGIDGYEILSGPVAVSDEHWQELKKILIDPEIYYWDRAKGCKFSPGVAIVYTSEKGSLDVLLCFGCDQIEIYQNGKRVGGEDFDKAREFIVAVVKKMFPDDSEIQALVSKKH